MEPMQDRSSLSARAVDTYKGWPKWARISAPVFTVLVVIAALGGGGNDEQPVEASAQREVEESTTTTELPEFEDPAEETAEVLRENGARLDSLSHDALVGVVMTACEELEGSGTTEQVGEAVVAALEAEMGDVTGAALEDLGAILSESAPVLCPDGVKDHPRLLRTMVRLAPTSTTAPTTTTTAAPTTTAPPVTLPATTVAPPPPPPPPPPPEAPPAASSTYYKNCDAARAAGAAPVRRGDPGYASHLDRDNDGVGCE